MRYIASEIWFHEVCCVHAVAVGRCEFAKAAGAGKLPLCEENVLAKKVAFNSPFNLVFFFTAHPHLVDALKMAFASAKISHNPHIYVVVTTKDRIKVRDRTKLSFFSDPYLHFPVAIFSRVFPSPAAKTLVTTNPT